MNRFGRASVTTVALLATARVASAQLAGIPYGPVETGTGIMLAADYAKPSDSLGGGTAYGITGGFGFGRFGLSASVGARDPGGSALGKNTSFGGRIGMRLVGGGLNPLSVGLQVGGSQTQNIGVNSTGGTGVMATYVAPGAWVKVSPPLFPLKPWGQVYYSTGNNRPAGAKDEVRFALGLNFNLLLGFGVHGAYDWGKTGSSWGVGAHFNFHISGVPVVPGV